MKKRILMAFAVIMLAFSMPVTALAGPMVPEADYPYKGGGTTNTSGGKTTGDKKTSTKNDKNKKKDTTTLKDANKKKTTTTTTTTSHGGCMIGEADYPYTGHKQ